MDKQDALQDINYIKQMMSQTQQILDIVWPIYIYWGIDFLLTTITFPYFYSIPDWETAPVMAQIASISLKVLLWAGYIFTAVYLGVNRKRLINPKMYLIGGIIMVIITVGLMSNIAGYFMHLTNAEIHMDIIRQLSLKYHILINGILLSTLLMILGLVYTREQFWMGFGLVFVTLFSIWCSTAGFGWISTNSPVILWGYLGICFLIIGIMAYRRHRDEEQESKQG